MLARLLWLFAAGLVCLGTSACAKPKTVTTRTVFSAPSSAPSWSGRTLADIERVWGQAPERESDGEGGTVLVYRQDTSFSVSSSQGTQPEGTAGSLGDPERTQSERITKVRARFWLAPDEKVYRVWFSPEVYGTGKELPPPAGDAPNP